MYLQVASPSPSPCCVKQQVFSPRGFDQHRDSGMPSKTPAEFSIWKKERKTFEATMGFPSFLFFVGGKS